MAASLSHSATLAERRNTILHFVSAPSAIIARSDCIPLPLTLRTVTNIIPSPSPLRKNSFNRFIRPPPSSGKIPNSRKIRILPSKYRIIFSLVPCVQNLYSSRSSNKRGLHVNHPTINVAYTRNVFFLAILTQKFLFIYYY